MSNGFIIGNGESRKNLNLETLKGFGPIYGCNALYRDFHPDILVVRDSAMYWEVKKNYTGDIAVFDTNTNEELTHVYKNGEKVSSHDLGSWNAGFLAIALMCDIEKEINKIFLLGFDPYPSKGTEFKNSFYKGTDNYQAANEKADYYVFNTINHFRKFLPKALVKWPEKVFHRVGFEGDIIPKEMSQFPNLKWITYDDFGKLKAEN